MKEKKKIRKLEFTKETVVRLGETTLANINGGHHTITRNEATCTCITYASMREPCNE
jgi:hypothetical protein